MEHNETTNWISIASQEHAQREKLQIELHTLKQNLQQVSQQLATVLSYNAQLETKVRALEKERTVAHNKLNSSFAMLKKAQQLMRKRSAELQKASISLDILQSQNAKLDTTLQEEKFAHEQTSGKLSEALERLAKQQDLLLSSGQVRRADVGSNEEFAYKMLYAPENSGIIAPANSLENE